ncbi:MAG: hypothetical protein ABW133_20560 [Polyangiaceae bacterium]
MVFLALACGDLAQISRASAMTVKGLTVIFSAPEAPQAAAFPTVEMTMPKALELIADARGTIVTGFSAPGV